jgi:hypothetical protein
MTDPFTSSYGPTGEVWNRSPGDVFQQFDRMWPTNSAWMAPDGQVQSLSFDLVEHSDRFVFIAGLSFFSSFRGSLTLIRCSWSS